MDVPVVRTPITLRPTPQTAKLRLKADTELEPHVSYEEEDTCVKADTEPVEGISRRQHVVHEF